MKDFETLTSLFFGSGLPGLEDSQGLVLGLAKANGSVAAKIIHKSDEILIFLQSGGFHRSAQVTKNPPQNLGQPFLHDAWYRVASLFPFSASRATSTTFPFNFHTSYCPLLDHHLDGILGNMAEAVMP